MMSRAILLVLFTLAFLATLALTHEVRPLTKLQDGFWELTDDYPNSVSHDYGHNSDTRP